MSEKINVLDIGIDGLTAKEAMKDSMGYLESEPVNIIEMITADGLMQISETQSLKEAIGCFDLVFPGDRTILEAARVKERKLFRETEDRTFLKMFLRYLHKSHRRVYLLVEPEEEVEELCAYFERRYSGLQIVGLAKVSAQDRADDMIVNAVNGGEVDCVIAFLPAPLQEEFIVRNKGALNARVWLGLGKEVFPPGRAESGGGRFERFVTRHIFKKKVVKERGN